MDVAFLGHAHRPICLDSRNSAPPQVVLSSNNSTAMSTDPMSTDSMYRCSQCKQFKPSDEYGTRQRGSNHGQKGDRLFCCRSCSASKSAKRKRERVEGNADRPEKRLATEPPISPSQFVEALAKHASASEIDDSWCISLDEITLTDKGIADHIASLAWKATGYRFT